MADAAVTIFLSGTRRDLAEFYLPAKTALEQAFPDCVVRMMEDAEPEDIPGDHWSRREATRPDVLVGLVGQYYGTVPLGNDRSLTEQEFDVAGQVGIERLMFLTDTGRADVLASQDGAARERVAAFRAKVDRSVVRRGIKTPDEFAGHAVAAVREWELRTLRGATQAADQHFAPLLLSEPLFSHTEPLVGQHDALNQLRAFTKSSSRILLLHAPWGRGKSRILLELARDATVPVRFVRMDAPLARTHLDVSAADPLVLVLEEPLIRTPEELWQLLAFLHRCDPRVKLIVAARSSALDCLEAMIRAEGIAASTVERMELPALSDGEQRKLIAQITGSDGLISHQLAVRTRGSALAAVLAARLIQRGQVTFADLDRNPDFVREVLGRFRDALLTAPSIDAAIRERLQALLHVLALCAPVRPGDEGQRDALAHFLNRQPEEISRDLETLEDHGLLIRRGGLVTIPVEGIREAEALSACLTQRGDLTGLPERALRELSGVFRGHLLQTLARVEWRAELSGQQVSLLERVWPELEAIYDVAPASVRLQLLKDLAGVAPFQPRRTVRFVQHAIPSGVGPPETEELFRLWGPVELTRIYDALTALLREVLYEPTCVGDACDLLHRMAQGDRRTAPQHPECARRVLLDLAKLDPHHPLACYEAFLDWAEMRLRVGGIPGEQLAEYVRPLLAKEMESGYADEQAMHFWSEAVSAERVRPLHARVLAILKSLARAPEPATAAAAIAAIGDALDPPSGIWNRRVTESELAAWAPEQLGAIRDLREIAEARNSRVIDVCVLQAVSSTVRFSEQDHVKHSASELHTELLARLEHLPALVLLPYWVSPWGPDEGSERKHLQATEDSATALMASRETPEEIVRRLMDTFDEMDTAGLQPDVARLLGALTKRNADIGETFTRMALDGADSKAAEGAGAALHALLEHDRTRGLALLDEAISRGGNHLKRAVARAYLMEPLRAMVDAPRALAHFKQLLKSDDLIVRVETLRAVWLANEWPPADRAALFLAYDPNRDGRNSIDMWALGMEHLFSALAPAQVDELAHKLEDVREIDYHVEGILLCLGAMRPDLVVDILLARVARAAQSSEHYEAIPFRVQRDFARPLPSHERRRCLVQLGPLLRLEGAFRAQHAAQQLFARLGGNDPEIKRSVRAEWAASSDAALVLCAAQSFRDETPSALFDEEQVVVEILRAASRLGGEVLQSAQSELLCASSNGVRTGTPGQPMPEDMAIRDRARNVAARYASGSVEAAFYEGVAKHAEFSIASLQRIHDEHSLE